MSRTLSPHAGAVRRRGVSRLLQSAVGLVLSGLVVANSPGAPARDDASVPSPGSGPISMRPDPGAGNSGRAAGRTATVSGRVMNQATGESLPGASVRVESTDWGTTAERGGTFTLALPAGDFTVVASYPGLEPARVAVTVRSGDVVRDIELTSAIYRLEAFTVEGVREGNARAFQLQRNALNPKTIVATDTFGQPAANPGELIQRLPGIATDVVGSEVRNIYVRGMSTDFSSLLVDGDRIATSNGNNPGRDFQIEQLGTGSLESVELIKAPAADQDANAIAGFVNLVSRRAFDRKTRRLEVSAGTVWGRPHQRRDNPMVDRPDGIDLFNFAYEDSFGVPGGEKNLGVALTFNRRVSSTLDNHVGAFNTHFNNFGQTYFNPTGEVSAANPDGKILQRAFGTSVVYYPQVARNIGVSADYKLGPRALAFFKFQYNGNDHRQKEMSPGFGNPSATLANFSADSTYEHSHLLPNAANRAATLSRNYNKESVNYAFSAGTELKLFGDSAKLTLRGSQSFAKITYPAWYVVEARAPNVGWELDRRGQSSIHFPIFRQTSGPSIYEAASYQMQSLRRQFRSAPNDLEGLRADFEKTFAGRWPIKAKTGLKYDDDRRKSHQEDENWTWTGADGVPNSADDSMAPYHAFTYVQGVGRYGPFPFIGMPGEGGARDPVAVPAGYWRQTAANAYANHVAGRINDLRFREKISAAYAMASTKLGRLRGQAGLRLERTETEGQAWSRNTSAAWGGNSVGGGSFDSAVVAANIARADRSFVRKITSQGAYQNLFPSVHLTYDVRGALRVRASYNRSIARQPVQNMVAGIAEGQNAAGTPTVNFGNPDLRPHGADNFEVSVERYFEPIGLISAGVFLKEISNYTQTVSFPIGPEGVDDQGTYAGYIGTTRSNIGRARIRGFEASYSQQFSFLPGILKSFGAFANFTYLDSKGDFGTATQTKQLTNKTPRSANGGINFRRRGLDLSLLANYKGQTLRRINSGMEIYAEQRIGLDLKGNYALTRTYSVFFIASNLLDEPGRTEITLSGLHFAMTNPGMAFQAGVRARF